MSCALLLAVLAPLAAPQLGAIERALARPELEGARVAVAVRDMDSGEMLVARLIDEPMAPASNLKLVTTAASLSILGPDAAFETRFLGAAPIGREGLLAGDLVVRGDADPCLRADALAPEGVRDPADLLAELLHASGLRRIAGDLVLDDGLLDREWVHPDWKAADLDNDYAAPIGALSIDGNTVSVTIEGTQARLATRAQGYDVRAELSRADSSSAFVVGLVRPDDHGAITVRGEVGRAVGSRVLRVPVRDPSQLFGRCLLAALERRGITVGGGLEVRPGAADAPGLQVVASLRTPLENALTLANKDSDNSISDHLFKRLGALVAGEGSFAGGSRAVGAFLRSAAGPAASAVVLRDGSGLSHANRVTARVMVDVLAAMAAAEPAVRDRFLRSLPVSGLDGSLRDRLREPPYAGAVRAKTGYISRTSCLSGYVRGTTGRSLAFSILINDFDSRRTGNSRMKAVQDEICRALVDLK